MTARLRAALETIASGTGPIGGRLGYEQMREIAREALREDDAMRRAIDSVVDKVISESLRTINIAHPGSMPIMAHYIAPAMAAQTGKRAEVGMGAQHPGYIVDDLLK